MLFLHGIGREGGEMGGEGARFEQQVIGWISSQVSQLQAKGEQFAFIPQYNIGTSRIDVLFTKPIPAGIEIKYIKEGSSVNLERQILETRIRLARSISPLTPLFLFLPEGNKIKTDNLAAQCIEFNRNNLELGALLKENKFDDTFIAQFEQFTLSDQEVSDFEQIEEFGEKVAIFKNETLLNSPITKNENLLKALTELALSFGLEKPIVKALKTRPSGGIDGWSISVEEHDAVVGTRGLCILINPNMESINSIFLETFLQIKNTKQKPSIVLLFTERNKYAKGSNWLYYLAEVINSLELGGFKVLPFPEKSRPHE